MKKNYFLSMLALTALTMGFASCNNDEDATNITGDQVLEIKLPDNVVTRAVDNSVTVPTATALSSVRYFLMNGEAKVASGTFDATDLSAGKKRLEQVASSVNRVIVVANIPSGEDATLAALSMADPIKKYAYTIASQNPAAATGIAGKTLLGDCPTFTTPADPAPDSHNYKQAAVTLNALTARIEIGAVVPGTGVANVEMVAVYINNYYTDGSKGTQKLHASADVVWDATPAIPTAPAATAFANPTLPAYTVADYRNMGDAQVTPVAGSKVYAFHTFAGNLPHIVMLVKGEYASGHYNGSDKYFMGWVTFTSFKDGGTPISTFDANKIYKIGVGASGIAITPPMITVPDPELTQFDLGVNVTVTPWTEVNVTPGI